MTLAPVAGPTRPLLVVALCGLVTLLEGFDLQAAGVAAPKLAPALHVAPALLTYWLPTLMVGRGLTQPQALSVQSLFGLLGAVGSLSVGALMDRLPRPPVVAGAFGLAAVSLVLLALAPARFGLALAVGALTGAAVSGAQASVYALAPGIYPAPVRGTGVGAAVGIGRVGSAIGPLLAGALIGGGASPAQVLMGLMPIAVIGGLATFSLALMLGRRSGR